MTLRAFQCFAAGAHTSADGHAYVFSERDVAGMAAAFDPSRRFAPLVLGHPKEDRSAPRYGEVKGLVAHGPALFAVADVEESLLTLMRLGRYKKVSASFLEPNAKDNPTPGSYYLRHVGFLGATPPAVKGMQPISFALAPDFAPPYAPVSFSAPALTAAERRSHSMQRITKDLQRACPGMPLLKAATNAERFI